MMGNDGTATTTSRNFAGQALREPSCAGSRKRLSALSCLREAAQRLFKSAGHQFTIVESSRDLD
jgi:hypothetical protein